MNRFKYFFKCAMALAVAGVLPSCGEKDEPLPALVPAYVTVTNAAEQALELLGDASSKDVAVEANRDLKITVPADAASWLTAEVKNADLTTGKATLSISVEDNTAAFKGRTASITIECVAAREGDIVTGASAKATIEVRQSLKGLPVADLFDLKLSADGKAEDGTGNLSVEIGPAAPKVTADGAYNRLYATISQVESAKYAQLLAAGTLNGTAAALGWGVDPGDKYWNEYNRDDELKYKHYHKDGKIYEDESYGNKRMSYYKMQWGGTTLVSPPSNAGQNEKIVTAYESAFSYELVFRVGTYGFNGNIFGNLNPTHCGFGIGGSGATETDVEGVGRVATGGKINFQYATAWGGGAQIAMAVKKAETNVEGSEAGVVVEQGVWYHVVVTFNRNAAIGSKAIVLYVDGKEITWVNNYADLKNYGLQFPKDYYAGSNGDHTHSPGEGSEEFIERTPNTEYLVVGGGSHQSGRPTFGVQEGTQVMIARVYGKALTPAEVMASYNALTP